MVNLVITFWIWWTFIYINTSKWPLNYHLKIHTLGKRILLDYELLGKWIAGCMWTILNPLAILQSEFICFIQTNQILPVLVQKKKSVKMSKLSCKEMILHHSMNNKWCNVNVFRALETQLVFVNEKGDYEIEVLSRVLFIPWNGLILLSVFSMWV